MTKLSFREERFYRRSYNFIKDIYDVESIPSKKKNKIKKKSSAYRASSFAFHTPLIKKTININHIPFIKHHWYKPYTIPKAPLKSTIISFSRRRLIISMSSRLIFSLCHKVSKLMSWGKYRWKKYKDDGLS